MGEPLQTDLAAFRAVVGMGNSEIGIIREAVRLYIDTKTAKDTELRERYEAERDRAHAAKRQPIRLVTAKDEKA